jgi:hypothetical protein
VLLLVDLDGVVYRASEGVPGVAEALAERAALGDQVVYVTNNAMHYHGDYLPRLEGHGAPTGRDRVVTSARASALYVRDEMPEVRRVLAVGASGLERELREAGLDVVTAAHAATRMSQRRIDGWEAAGTPTRSLWASIPSSPTCGSPRRPTACEPDPCSSPRTGIRSTQRSVASGRGLAPWSRRSRRRRRRRPGSRSASPSRTCSRRRRGSRASSPGAR